MVHVGGETDRDPVPALSGLQKEVGDNDPVLTPAQGEGIIAAACIHLTSTKHKGRTEAPPISLQGAGC